jgi:hypothetical protein
VTQFAEFFRLRDPHREGIKLSPEHDAEVFVDIDGLLPKVVERLRTAPKLVVFGDYGTGKTQLLRHIEQKLAASVPLHPVYIVLSGFERRSRFQRVHTIVMQALEDTLTDLVTGKPDVEAWIRERRDVAEDVRNALLHLARPTLPPGDRTKVRAWLKGTGPTALQAQKLGLSARLFDLCGPADLVKVWRCIGQMHQEHSPDRSKLLLLFDEGESIQQIVSPEGQHDVGSGLRALLDEDTRELGCVFGLNLPSARATHPFLRTDIERRIGDGVLHLRPLGGPQRVRDFTTALWGEISDGLPLLANDALPYVGERLMVLLEKLGLTFGPPNRMATQSDLLMLLDRVAQTAFQRKIKPPIPLSEVQAWLEAAG